MRLSEEPPVAIAQEWDELADRLRAPPFLMSGWFTAWWQAFGEEELRVITVRDEGRLVGVMPVIHGRRVIRSPTNWHTPMFGPLAESAEVSGRIYRHLLQLRPRRLDLSFIDSKEDGFSALTADEHIHLRPMLKSPYLPVVGDWETYWASRSKNLRSTVRRCRNRLADLGQVKFDVRDGREELSALLEEGFQLEHSGWKERRGTSIAARPETKQFYEDLAGWAAARGFLRLAFIRIDGAAVAFNYGFELHGSHYLIKLGHDVELQRFGPGTVLTAEMVERAFREGLDTYEFLGAAERYKLRWSESCHERVRLQAFARTPPGRLDGAIQIHGRRVAKWLLGRFKGSSALS